MGRNLRRFMRNRREFLSRSIAAAVAVASGLWLSPAPAAGPRVASMNVCTDQLLIELADPEQIAGLSRFSRDVGRSFAANDARRFPVLSGGAEDILLLKPDIVVTGLFDKHSTREFLREHGVRIAEFAVPRNLDEAKAQMRRMGEIVQHADRATAEIARLDAAVARARQTVTEKHYSVLPLFRRGWVAGSDSLISSLLAETGLFNMASDLGTVTGGFASLEAIVSARPDFLVVSEADDRAEDEGRAFLLHPALERLYPPAKRIVIPERLTVCGGAMLAEALDVLVKELQRVSR
jgi:iron complex transport system substrate-binding protein